MALLAPPWVRFPTIQTLAKYGLDIYSWTAMGREQNWVCAVCKKKPKNGRFVVDHEHCRGWTAMPPEQRRAFCRGLLDSHCNRYKVAKLSLSSAEDVVEYLKRYEERRNRVTPEQKGDR